MPPTDSTTLPVLVVGAPGSLGSKVVDELLRRGKNVRALVRPATDASRLESRGVEIARGDMLNVDRVVRECRIEYAGQRIKFRNGVQGQ